MGGSSPICGKRGWGWCEAVMSRFFLFFSEKKKRKEDHIILIRSRYGCQF